MANLNPSIVISLLIGLVSLVCLIYVTRRQFLEVLVPVDWLTRLRWIILLTLLVAIIGAIPVLVYTLGRLYGHDSETLRNVASVTGNLSRLATSVLLVMIYNYRKEE